MLKVIILIKVNKFKYTTELIQIKAKQTAIKNLNGRKGPIPTIISININYLFTL